MANMIKQITPLGSSTTYDLSARYMHSPDTRSATINPNDLVASKNGIQFDFKQKSITGLTANYSGVMSYRPYAQNSDWSGGPAHQLAFDENGLHWRKSTGDTTWGTWEDIVRNSGTWSISITGNAATATKFASAQSIALTGDTTGSSSSQAGWSIATTTTKLSYPAQLTTLEAIDTFGIDEVRFKVARVSALDGHSGTLTKNDGMIMNVPWSAKYGHQVFFDDSGYGIHHRYDSNGTWQPWVELIGSNNYTSYTVKKDGTGATGTWDISISGNAAIATKLSNTPNNTTTFLRGDNTWSNTLTGPIYIPAVAKDNYIAYPDGAFWSAQQTQTGAIKITLPVSWTATMMLIKVDIYNYNDNNAITYTIGGYNYTGGDGYWTNCSSYSNGFGDKSNLKIRFGHDGIKCCILIGEVNTAWSYPKVQVRNVLLGHSGTTITNWATGWSIGIVTTLPENIDVVKENPAVIPIEHGGTGNTTGNAATATKLSNTPNNTTTFLRGDNTWTNQLTNTFYSTASPGFNNTVAAGNWSYLRLHNGSNLWDVATKSSEDSGALQFRPAGNANIGPEITTAGMLISSNSGSTSTGATSEAAIQVREYHRGGAQSDNWGIAPRLAWNWNGRTSAQIGLASNGYLYEAPLAGTTYYKLVYESGTWAISISGNAATATTATEAKWLMNRGTNVTIADSSWSHNQKGRGGTNTSGGIVWKQKWTQSGLTYTPSGGSATNLTDSGDIVYWLSQDATANNLWVNMAIDGYIYTHSGIKILTQSAGYSEGIRFVNSSGTDKGSIGCDTNGTLGIYASKISIRPELNAATKGLEITTSAVYPTTAVTLGTTSNKWSTVYATTFDGNATSATTATTATKLGSSNVGSATQPIYLSGGSPTACTAYSGLLTALSWTGGTSAGPTLSITVGGTTKTSVIPSASASASGIVTTGGQTFAGDKIFNSNNFEVRADVIRLRNKNNNNNQAGTNPYVTSLVMGDGRYVSFDEYKDDHLALRGSSILLNTATAFTAYDPTKTYTVGTIVWYDKSYYICKTAIETAEEWDSTHWTAMPTSGVMINAQLNPWKTNTYSLGTSSYRWQKLYIGTADSYGSSTEPIYWDSGLPKKGSTYAGGTAVTLNGTSKAASTASFYAPTAAGTSGQYLMSNGSGAPTWSTIVTTDVLVKQTAKTDNVNYKLLMGANSSPSSGTAYEAVYDANITVNPSTHTITATNFAGTATTATKLGTTTVGGTSKPIYLNAGTATECSNYAGGTAITLNNTNKGANTASFYAPTAGGTANTQALVGNGTTSEPKWVNISPSITITAGTSSAAPKVNVTVLGQSGTAQAITTATTGLYGCTKLSSTQSTTEEGLAATPKGVWAAINTLDFSSVGGTGKYISQISQTDGKISATATDTSVSNTWADGTTAGPTISTTVNGITGAAVAIPSASASISGAVTTGAQTFAGAKTFNGTIIERNSSRWPAMYFQTTGSSNYTGGLIWSGADADGNITGSRILLRAYSYNGTANANALTYYEDYQTPACDANRSANVTYELLTTKNLVTIAQGGTGASTAAGARANLGTWSLISDSYNTIMPADGTTNGWYKFGTSNTSYGILPSASGAAGSGHNYIGTSSWYWKYAYIDEIHGALKGNADTATKLATARTISLTGAVTGSGSFDGSGNLSIATTANHNHDSVYVKKAGDTMTGNLTMTTGKSVLRAGTSRSWINGRDTAIIRTTSYSGYDAIASMKTTNGAWEIGVYTSDNLWFTYTPDEQYNSNTNSGYAQTHITKEGKVYGAVWNDYAEMRNVPEAQKGKNLLKPGSCVREVGDGTMVLATKRLERGCKIISDTFGFNIGETDDCKTPIAVSGRVLVYIAEGREEARNHIGWPVCSGPDGTVSIMSEEEEEKYPSRIVGTISEIPEYEEWGTEKVKVNGRIWIYVR